jgi:hypothetical protein
MAGGATYDEKTRSSFLTKWEPEGHVHHAVQLDRSGQLRAGLGAASDLGIQLPEAEALVGKRVLTLAAWSSIPQGTTGRVISTVPAGQILNRYDVAIQWDLPAPIPRVNIGQVADESLSVLHAGQPLVDWMTKDEYRAVLTELP